MANMLTVITSLGGAKNEVKVGVVKRDWVPTGRIDFATNLDNNNDPNQPSEFKLLVEERRIVESVCGNENLDSVAARHTERSKSRRSSALQIPERKRAPQICIRP
jgi:hypothetical protein